LLTSKRAWIGLAFVLLLVVVLGVAAGCGGSTTTTAAPGTTGTTGTTTPPASGTTATTAGGNLATDQTLVMNISTEPPSLDPDLASDTTSMKVINNIFEGLVTIDMQGNPLPAEAASWDVSTDGLTYTFHLRGTDKWTNGDTVTSADYKYGWLRCLDPSTAADYAYQLYYIKGAQEYNTGKGTAADVAIDASDPTLVKVTLTAPTPWWVALMSQQYFFPVPQKAVEQFKDKWTEPANIVTNGPFKLTSWNHDSDITITKWDGWRDASKVTLQTVKMPMINADTTAVAAFENGELDQQDSLPVADMDRLKTLPTYHQVPMLGIYYYGYNVKHSPLDKVEVRQALSLAIDRQSIIDNVTKAGQLPASNFVPQGMPGFDAFNVPSNYAKPTADVAGAKDLLSKAGYPNGTGLPEIVIYYNTNEGHQAIATAIQAQWKAVGVNATLKNMEWKQYLDFVQNNDQVMVYRMGWVADFNEAYNFLDVLRGGGGNNFTRWADPTYDASFAKALAAPDANGRYAVYKQMEQILADQMPVAPIYWYTHTYLLKEWVNNFEMNPLGGLLYLTPVTISKH
jgi:oligopeptide transport system substrate-binding protein